MSMHKPPLYLHLLNRPQKAQPRELLKLQYRKSMILRHVPNPHFPKYGLRRNTRAPVESIRDDPVEHLYQEREFLEDSTVVVVAEAGGVGGVDDGPETVTFLGRVLHGGHGVDAVVVLDG